MIFGRTIAQKTESGKIVLITMMLLDKLIAWVF